MELMREELKDMLQEIANIGLNHAATALSQLMGQPVTAGIPKIRMIPFDQAAPLLGSEDEVRVGVLMEISGGLNGMFMFLLSEAALQSLLQPLILERPGLFELSALSCSACCEIGNIMNSSYVNVLAQMIQAPIQVSPPQLSVDMIGALMCVPIIMTSAVADELLMIENQFHIEAADITSHILFFPDPDSVETLAERLIPAYENS